MKIDTSNNELLKRYLLDDISDEDRRQIEERFISDDTAFDEILAVEDELFFEYGQNELNARERSVFEKKFLRTPEDHEKAAFAGAFLEATTDLAAKGATSIHESKPGFWGSIGAFFIFNPAQIGMAAAVLVLFAVAIGLLIQNTNINSELADMRQSSAMERQNSEGQLNEKESERKAIEERLATEREKNLENDQKIKELETEREKLGKEIDEIKNRITVPGPSKTGRSTFATLILSPGLFTRNNGKSMDRIDLSDSVKLLRLNLLLKTAENYERFNILLASIDSGNTIWSRSDVKASGKEAKRRLMVDIPANILMRTDYEITLTGVTKTGEFEEIGKYYFSVNK